MSNKIKKLIIILLIVSGIILFIICSLKTKIKNQVPKDLQKIGENGDIPSQIYNNKMGDIIGTESYLSVKTCMQKYIDIININSALYGSYDLDENYISIKNEEEINLDIFNILSNKFIEEKNITKNNIRDNVKILKNIKKYVPIEIKQINDGKIQSYLTYGIMGNLPYYEEPEKIYAVVNIDFENNLFSIEPIYEQYNNINEIKYEKYDESINDNITNRFTPYVINSSSIPTEYTSLYKGLALGAPEILYDLIDEEYKQQKFKNLDELKNYIQKNREEISKIKLDKYKLLNMDDESRTYLCIDDKENKYIIKQKYAFQEYTIMLDTYTIDLPQFIEEYDKSSEDEKVLLNIQKINEAIKQLDYEYVYSKLDETFKNTNYKTLNSFENYLEKYFNTQIIKIEYISYQKINDVNVYEIEITNKINNNVTNANIIMKLLPQRDFVFSFGVIED